VSGPIREKHASLRPDQSFAVLSRMHVLVSFLPFTALQLDESPRAWRGLSLVEDVPLLLVPVLLVSWDEAPAEDSPDAAGVAATVAIDSSLRHSQILKKCSALHCCHHSHRLRSAAQSDSEEMLGLALLHQTP
jgi:hypothetical protein